ncbi:MAG: hypothetical protein MUF81_02685 [Verrucomicrobia bacterium]|jgi:chromosome segregation ATPase|nr:hypothetical protein [Verrucomicrobiota bacterium]
MKKFSTPILIVLTLVAAVAINGWRGAGGKFNVASTDLTTTSNKLAEAAVKLAEQGATIETLRVQLNLQKSDLAAASNHISALAGQVSKAAAQTRGLESQLQNRFGEIDGLSRSKAQLETKISDLEVKTAALQAAREGAKAQVAETAKRLESANAALNESESAKAALLAKLNDPSTLRAQLKSANAPVTGPKPKGKEPLVLNPDGSVGFATSAVNVSP